MPTIVFASSKGGAGKTTATIILACEIALRNSKVTLIDADPNQHSAKWANKSGCPEDIVLIEKSTEETIIEDIDSAQEKTAFVLVDLEGTASMAVASAISRADLVVTLCQGSQDDADEAAKTIKLVYRQSKILNRKIPIVVLMTRTNPAITPRTLKFIMNEFKQAGIEILNTSLIDREAFRAIRSFGGTVNGLDPKQVSGIDKAAANARALAAEIVQKLRDISKEE